LCCRAGSREFCTFQAVADALTNAHILCKVTICLDGQTFPGHSSRLTALANALREHKHLQEFNWFDFLPRLQAEPQELSPDLMLRALSACPHLRKVSITTPYASAGATRTLLQLLKDVYLTLVLTDKEHWLAVADGIRQGQCTIKSLKLALLQSSSFEATEAVKAIAGAIHLDHNLERLNLQIMNCDCTNEAGVALAEALTVNKTLRKITLYLSRRQVQGADALYDAFSAMLRVNTSLALDLFPFDDAVGDERLFDSRNQMRFEQRLHEVGRGRLLSSSQTTREEWFDALDELNSYDNVDESPEFNVSCLYGLLRLNPATCMS
jgi:Ran GTPase-activating protein (RanGAP) involved in mRNA processing and transport